MNYLDTGCLVKLYYPKPESASVAAAVFGKVFIFSSLHDIELTDARQLAVAKAIGMPLLTS
jgi:predicted nucleic acid-binding protein